MTLTYISLFAGIEGFGFAEAGMTPLAFVEQNLHARSILKRHYPDVPQFEDVRDVRKRNLPAVSLICGGFPCTDVSVAGRRAGLAGSESGLWFEFHRIIHEIRPAWVVIENVPGLFSSNAGKDFAVVLGGLTGSIPSVPDRGWKNGGAVRGHDHLYHACWRVFDAQHFGTPQRRRRVFIVANLATLGGRCAEVLFERDSSNGNSSESAAERQGTTTSAEAGVDVGIGATSYKKHGGFGFSAYQRVATTLEGHSSSHNVERIPMVVDTTQIASPTNSANPQPGDRCHTLNAHAHVPLLVGTLGAANGRNRGLGQENEVDMLVVDKPVLAFRKHGYGKFTPDTVAETVTSHERKEASTLIAGISGELNVDAELIGTLDAGSKSGSGRPALVAQLESNVVSFQPNASSDDGQTVLNDKTPAMRTDPLAIASATHGVRRLTPIECERLQGFPDDFTKFGYDDKPISDTARYERLGNAVNRAVGMVLGKRILEAAK